jgi:type I restriction enzyme M protein
MRNDFCDSSDLTNEASVETWFVDRLLVDLGYPSHEIRLKTSLKELKVGKGSKSAWYKPDYVILVDKIPSLVIDAKAPDENIDDYTYQCSSYCLELNKAFDYNPVEYYFLTNGLRAALYKWDRAKPILTLEFSDFVRSASKYEELRNAAGRSALSV